MATDYDAVHVRLSKQDVEQIRAGEPLVITNAAGGDSIIIDAVGPTNEELSREKLKLIQDRVDDSKDSGEEKQRVKHMIQEAIHEANHRSNQRRGGPR